MYNVTDEAGGVSDVVVVTPAKLAGIETRVMAQAAGVPVPPGTYDVTKFPSMQAFVRAKMHERNPQYVDKWFDTLDNAQEATDRTGRPDFRTQLDSVKIQMSAAGVIGPASRVVDQPIASTAGISEDMLHLSGTDLVAALLRQAEAALTGVPIEDIPLPQITRPAGSHGSSLLSIKPAAGSETIITKSGVEIVVPNSRADADGDKMADEHYSR